MAQVQIIVTNYYFKKPPLMSEGDYLSYKQIFSIDPAHSLEPKNHFWKEFESLKWMLIVFVGGGVLMLFNTELGFIPAFALFLMVISMFTGTGKSLLNYQNYCEEKANYYVRLKDAIVSSRDYPSFRSKISSI
ncbi:hypothetical protein [Dyadobacter chenhuakuii]|uniref:Uncharacterized protein n=1 Tax=Dyadobacter chenhuakuii TaxID=2909339 RepID=A0A9X1QIY3_9BACT|nr:hypothetical protein [Dyadobacter chenhuakuii]MCF2501689.1 hypothetical protein [Dyadobacter chenhuakuii]